ncbi:hypothetical protein [Companilactobacillus farciminis]|uniref:hypothetical protein n=1 Tax=Companilactobacillus farciminis TaxID=1612 RepID=UPI001F1884FD|nr:hypothetical protein [Companilactobacillus farciminis]
MTSGTDWKSDGIRVIGGKPYYHIGVDTLIPQSSTTFSKVVVVNYRSDYGVNAYDSNGNYVDRSNKIFKGGTSWQITPDLVNISKIGWCYKVASNEYIPIKYAQGSGYKG